MYRENPKTSVLAVLKDAVFFFFHLQPVKVNTEKDLSNKIETRSQGEDQILSMITTFLVKNYKWFKIVHRKSFRQEKTAQNTENVSVQLAQKSSKLKINLQRGASQKELWVQLLAHGGVQKAVKSLTDCIGKGGTNQD